MRSLIAIALLLAVPSLAQAFDGQDLWYTPANGGIAPPGDMTALPPGGGGIFGTGGAHDYGITCGNCHLNDKLQQGKIDLAFVFSPALGSVAGQATYKPGQTYTVTATMSGEHLGQSGCDQYVTGNINNFAATIENASGKTAGALSSDSGQSSTSCPAKAPMVSSGTTMVYGDCKVIFSMGGAKTDAGRVSWTFTWTAPAAGSGALTMFWGVVDGDCMMDSLNDDVKVGTTRMAEATAAREQRTPTRWAFVLLGPLVWIAGGLAGRNRQRRTRSATIVQARNELVLGRKPAAR